MRAQDTLNEFGAVMRFVALAKPVDMILDRVGRYAERTGDLLVGKAVAKQ